MEIKQLVDNGFVIFTEESKFIIEKRPTLLNKTKIDKSSFESLEEAINFIETYIKLREWKAIVRYNRGLGIEYKTLKVIKASSILEAKEEARKEAENAIGDYIIEIKVVENF